MRIPEAFYKAIQRVMPIPCVDLMITNCAAEVLLVRRANEPARGQWWFPGGRVHFGETREAAARRKLAEECGLLIADIQELWTRDVILPIESDTRTHHGITTVFLVNVVGSSHVKLDQQSSEFAWRDPVRWQEVTLHPFIREGLSRFGGTLSNDLPHKSTA